MPSYEIEVSLEISAAHALRGYEGPCANTHGHNWLITLYATGTEIDELGFCLDFKHLKAVGRELSARIDHQDLNAIEPFTRINPTAENLARWLFEEGRTLLRQECPDRPVQLSRVRVQETSRCAISYSPTTPTFIDEEEK